MLIIVGNQGNMGRRYAAIARYLNVQHDGYDSQSIQEAIENKTHELIKKASKIIVATSTNAHVTVLETIGKIRGGVGIDILCEKPITTNRSEFRRLYRIANEAKLNLYMVNNYSYIEYAVGLKDNEMPTIYDYYHSGKDGLVWDCIQLVGNALQKIILRNNSPVWRVVINGHAVSYASIDGSYIRMMEDFLGNQKKLWGKEKIVLAHDKCFMLTDKLGEAPQHVEYDLSRSNG